MTLLLGFSSGKSKGPFGIEFCGHMVQSATAANTLSGSFNLGTPYSDRSIWVGTISSGANPTSITVGGVSAVAYSSVASQGCFLQWRKAVSVPGAEGVNVSVSYSSNQRFIVGVFAVTGALGGLGVAPEAKVSAQSNDNTAGVTYSSRAIGDIFLASGVKPNTSVNWVGFTGNPTQADPLTLLDIAFGDNNGGFGRSVQQTGTTSATVVSNGADSSKNIGINCLRFSKGI